MKKSLSVLLCIAMLLSLLTGCGGRSQEATTEQKKTTTTHENMADQANVQEIPAEESAGSQAASYSPDAPNVFSLRNNDNWKESIVITFNDQKLCVSDWSSSWSDEIDLERIGDTRSVLDMALENMSLEEACQGPMDRIGGSISQTDPRKETLCGRDIYYYEVLTEYSTYYFFAMELGENLVLTNWGPLGYQGDVPFEEMMTDAFLSIETGDGTLIRPPFPYETSVENNTVHIRFDSGAAFSLPCAHERADVSAERNCVGAILYLSEEEDNHDEFIVIDAHISDDYSDSRDFIETRVISMNPVQNFNANGLDVFYVTDPEWGDGAFYIPLTDGYAVCGILQCYSENVTDPADGLFMWLMGENTDTLTVDHGYVAPTELGYEMESMTYRLDGVVYQFPTPVSEFAKYGWKVPDMFQGDMVPAGETMDMGLVNDYGSIIYNVTVQNPTGRELAPKDCLVIRMIVATDSNVTLDFPEGLSLYSSDMDMGYTTSSRMTVTGGGSSYGYYTWNNEDYTTTIWGYFDTDTGMINYFEFTHY